MQFFIKKIFSEILINFKIPRFGHFSRFLFASFYELFQDLSNTIPSITTTNYIISIMMVSVCLSKNFIITTASNFDQKSHNQASKNHLFQTTQVTSVVSMKTTAMGSDFMDYSDDVHQTDNEETGSEVNLDWLTLDFLVNASLLNKPLSSRCQLSTMIQLNRPLGMLVWKQASSYLRY